MFFKAVYLVITSLQNVFMRETLTYDADADGMTCCLVPQGLLMVHRSAFHNFLHVFGRYWILHLLIPFPRRRASTDPRSFLKIV